MTAVCIAHGSYEQIDTFIPLRVKTFFSNINKPPRIIVTLPVTLCTAEYMRIHASLSLTSHTCKHTHIQTHICTHTHTHKQTHTSVHTHAHMPTHTHTQTYTH